jgi:hypothetical protein
MTTIASPRRRAFAAARLGLPRSARSLGRRIVVCALCALAGGALAATADRARSAAAGSLVPAMSGVAIPFVSASARPARWQRDVAAYDRVTLGEPWPGITVDLAARGRAVEKIFTVAPGADVRRIQLRVDGANRLVRGAGGELVTRTRGGTFRFSAPVAW